MNKTYETIYGTIGYIYLKLNDQNILILADQHDTLPSCDNKINVANWFKKKLSSSEILLEEVPREENNKLIELWQHSPHTQELKQLYLDNPTSIPGMDIRPFMIPFSWEVLDETNISDKDYDIDMIEYLKNIDNFFSLENTFLISNLSNYNINIIKNTLLGKHFLLIKNKYSTFLEKLNNKNLLNNKIRYLVSKHNNELEILNNILDTIMEWYICAQIILYKDKSIIIHAGLAHTEKIVELLELHYGFEIKHQGGINSLNKIGIVARSGCIDIPLKISNLFGGRTKLIRKLKNLYLL
jgi:hypothetical protein